MIDAQGRAIEYLRVSITDRCNLRCRYCMPEDLPSIGHDQVLRYEEVLRVCRAAAELGVRRYKVTGGEPLVRRGCTDFLRRLKAAPGVEWVSITTNGVLLEPVLGELQELGVDGINISLDTLRRERYRALTGQDALPAVLCAMERAVAAGLRVKVNCVPLAGVNADELVAIAALAEWLPVDVRFIELMPTAAGQALRPVPGERVREQLLERFVDLRPCDERRGWGPARYWRSDKLQGRIGFIDAITGHFCDGCNRVRLTSEGYLKLCLYHDDGVPLRELLRGGADDAQLRAVIADAVREKPRRHCFGQGGTAGGIQRMSGIGG